VVALLAYVFPLKEETQERNTSHPAVDAGYPDNAGVGEK
jgi:hypothetical protein